MLRFGKITEVNPKKCYARVTFTDDGIVSGELQILTRAALVDKDSFTFEINEQVAVLMDENSEEGVILGAVFNDKTNPPDGGGAGIFRMTFGDGSQIEYNRNSHEFNLSVHGVVNVSANQVNVEADVVDVAATTVNVEADTVQIEGETTIEGNLTVSGNITGANVVGVTSISAPSISGPGVTMSGGNLEATGQLKGATVKAGSIDLAAHKHSGVTTGPGTSGAAVP